MLDVERRVGSVVVHIFATGEDEHMEFGFPEYAIHIIDERPDHDDVFPLGFPTRKAAEVEFRKIIAELKAGWNPFP